MCAMVPVEEYLSQCGAMVIVHLNAVHGASRSVVSFQCCAMVPVSGLILNVALSIV